MRREKADYYEPGAGGSIPSPLLDEDSATDAAGHDIIVPNSDTDPVSHEAPLQTHEWSRPVLVTEYILRNMRPAISTPVLDKLERANYFDFEDYEDGYDRQLFKSQLNSIVHVPLSDGSFVHVAPGEDDTERRYHLVAKRQKGGTRIISPAFDELVELTPQQIIVRMYDRYFAFAQGTMKTQQSEKDFTASTLPSCLDPGYTVRMSDVTPSTPSNVIAPVADSHWQILDTDVVEAASLPEKQSYANDLFELSIQAIFNHVERHLTKYPDAKNEETAINLPALSIDGRHYRVAVASSAGGTTLIVQRIQPGGYSGAVGDAMAGISTEDFKALLDRPDELQRIFDESLAEGKLLVTQPPHGDVMIIGGDDYEKRLEAKDSAFIPVMKNTTNLIKAYLDHLERLPVHEETLFDKRRALSTKIAAEQEKNLTRSQKFGRFMSKLWREFLIDMR